MRMLTAILLLIFFLSFLQVDETNVNRLWDPGVAKGDFFYYEAYGVFISNRSNATLAIPLFESNITGWVRINITEVTGSNVTQLYTIYFKNGSDFHFNLTTDLNPEHAGIFKFADKGIPVTAANLQIGDPLPTNQLAINSTIIRIYQSGQRETNIASWSLPEDWGYCRFDRQTGVLVELYRIHKFTNQATGETIEKTDVINLFQTNSWKI